MLYWEITVKKQWTYKHGEDTILVENTWFGEERLFVNGSLQGKRLSLCGTTLWGGLPTGEEVRASLGGVFAAQCFLFVGNKFLHPENCCYRWW